MNKIIINNKNILYILYFIIGFKINFIFLRKIKCQKREKINQKRK